LEDVPTDDAVLTSEEQYALDHFQDTHSRTAEGRYVVSVPLRKSDVLLGSLRETVLRRYNSNRKALERKGQWDHFHQAVQEYITLDHAEVLSADQVTAPPGRHFYMPMHGVVMEASTTTKLRVVFDRLAKTSTGHSLNDALLPGPFLYPLLVTVFNRFRSYTVGMSGDVSKMFREVAFHPDDRDLHRFIHQADDNSRLDCRMKRLTFGVASFPSWPHRF